MAGLTLLNAVPADPAAFMLTAPFWKENVSSIHVSITQYFWSPTLGVKRAGFSCDFYSIRVISPDFNCLNSKICIILIYTQLHLWG